ncbi:MAG: hemolysin family protein [Monoglobaceae bacterium]
MFYGRIILTIIAEIVLAVIYAVLSAAEVSAVSAAASLNGDASRGGEASSRAEKLFKITKKPAEFLSALRAAILFDGFLFCGIAVYAVSPRLTSCIESISESIPHDAAAAVSVLLIVFAAMIIIRSFGELVPQRAAVTDRERAALFSTAAASAAKTLFTPAAAFMHHFSNLCLRLSGIDPDEGSDVTEEEIRMLVDEGGEAGVIDVEEKEFIRNVFEFDDLTAADIVTHRTDIAIIWRDDDISEWEKTIHENRYTRYVVCGDSEDDVLGILDARDYFRIDNKNKDIIMKEAVHPAYFVPDTIGADVLFDRMRRGNHRIAVVLDEYGGMCGIITLIDLVEQLVGDLGNSDDDKEIMKISADTWQIYGSASLRDVCDELDLQIDAEEDSATFGGLILSELGYVPEDGSCPEITVSGYNIKVTPVRDHRIGLTTVHRLKTAENEENTEGE